MLYEHYLALAAELSDRIAALDQSDEATRDQLFELLQRVDLLHREGLIRLVDALRAAGAGEALERAAEDPVVRVLLGLYGLISILWREPGGGSTYVTLFGHQRDAHLVGAVSLFVAALLIGAAVLLLRLRRSR